jgi:DNA-binding GntR family transcriptional regulator
MDEIGIGRTATREALLRSSAESPVIFSGPGIEVAPVILESIAALYTARLHAERLAWELWLRRGEREQVARQRAAFERAGERAKREDD